MISNSETFYSSGGLRVKADEKNFDKTSFFAISLVVKDPSSCTIAGIKFCNTVFLSHIAPDFFWFHFYIFRFFTFLCLLIILCCCHNSISLSFIVVNVYCCFIAAKFFLIFFCSDGPSSGIGE